MIEGWTENRGDMPRYLKGASVYVRLRNGIVPDIPWPAVGTDWSLSEKNFPFDVMYWKRA